MADSDLMYSISVAEACYTEAKEVLHAWECWGGQLTFKDWLELPRDEEALRSAMQHYKGEMERLTLVLEKR